MGRLCGGAHEISGIPASLWLHGWMDVGVGGGEVGGQVAGMVGGMLVRGGWVVWWCGEGWC